MEMILFFIHYILLLIFGVVLSAAFSGVIPEKGSVLRLGGIAALSAGLQLGTYLVFGERAVWQLYPFVTHLPLILGLRFLLGRPFSVAIPATAFAYLCCQPARWFGLATLTLGGSPSAELGVRIAALLLTLAVTLHWFSGKIARIYGSRHQGAWAFGITPVVYYLFDYAVSIYTSLWQQNHELVVEFLPFFLCLGHLLFCAVYHRQFQLKREAEDKEHLLRITLEQQAREVETIRRSEGEIRLLRHDLKLFLNSLSACVEEGDKETARKLISSFSDRTEASSLRRYCGSDTLNYVLSDFAAQCREKDIPFQPVVELEKFTADEILFSSILANALDNAMNAQAGLAQSKRGIRLMLKTSGTKTLLSVKNRFCQEPQFREGLPVTDRLGHGYGTQSIRYATEKLGGNCRFSLEEDWFVLQVVV